MGKRLSIYISDMEVLASLKKAAKEDDRSVSNYLIRLHQANIRTIQKAIKIECKANDTVIS